MVPDPPISLSVIIPTYDEPERLCATLKSLADQDYPHEAVEIIVVDDASPNLEAGRLACIKSPFPTNLIRHRENQGRARARNTGLRAAAGEVVVFLDSDMTVRSDFLSTHAALHHIQPDTVCIGNIRFGTRVSPNALTRYMENRGVHRINEGQPVPFKCFVTGNASLRRNQLLQAGLFDEDFTAYGGEDLELGYRLHLQGAPFQFVPRALSFHNHLRPFEQTCQLMYTYGRRSLPLLLKKHPELAKLLRLDFLQKPRFSLRHLFFSATLSPAVYYPVEYLTRRGMRHYVPDLFFDYLWWYHRTRGYIEVSR